MADYTAAIGTGTIMIRDTGGNVEFWITAGNGTAWDYDLAWSGVINGRGVGGTFRYSSGMGWQRLFVEHVGSNQQVSFTKTYNSGSTGLGGPATVSAWIQRSTIPPAPTALGCDQITQTSMRYRFSGNGDGGSGILEWQIGWSDTIAGVEEYVSSNGTTVFTGLQPHTWYYFWSRGRNAHGWSAWSGRSEAITVAGAYIEVGGVIKEAIPYVKNGGVYKLAQPYVKQNGIYKATD
jgi:hypothetical protein